MKELIIKKSNKINSNLGGMLLIIGLKIIEIILLLIEIGGDKKGIKLDVVDEELGKFKK
jgi:hypothetical protein